MDVRMKEIRFEEEDEKKKAPEMPDPLTEKFMKHVRLFFLAKSTKTWQIKSFASF